MISRSAAGIAAIRAASTTRVTSFSPISWSARATATTPRLFWEATCSPETATAAPVIRTPAIRSARSTASSMARVVASRSTTTPFRTPVDGEVPIPAMWTSPSSSWSPTMTQTLVVPMSTPTNGPRLTNRVRLLVRLRDRRSLYRRAYSTRWCVLLPPRGGWGGRRDGVGGRRDGVGGPRGRGRPRHGLHDHAARDPEVHVVDLHAPGPERGEHLGHEGEALLEAAPTPHPHRDPVAELEDHFPGLIHADPPHLWPQVGRKGGGDERAQPDGRGGDRRPRRDPGQVQAVHLERHRRARFGGPPNGDPVGAQQDEARVQEEGRDRDPLPHDAAPDGRRVDPEGVLPGVDPCAVQDLRRGDHGVPFHGDVPQGEEARARKGGEGAEGRHGGEEPRHPHKAPRRGRGEGSRLPGPGPGRETTPGPHENSPRSLISASRSTPKALRTLSRTSSMRARTSAARAPPRFRM